MAPATWALRHGQSPAVTAWTPSQLHGEKPGELFARTGGDHNTAVVLLHGLVSTGELFGANFDQLAEGNRLVVPDLLGFGRSIDHSRESFSPEAHLEALDELADPLGCSSADGSLALTRWGLRWHCDGPPDTWTASTGLCVGVPPSTQRQTPPEPRYRGVP